MAGVDRQAALGATTGRENANAVTEYARSQGIDGPAVEQYRICLPGKLKPESECAAKHWGASSYSSSDNECAETNHMTSSYFSFAFRLISEKGCQATTSWGPLSFI